MKSILLGAGETGAVEVQGLYGASGLVAEPRVPVLTGDSEPSRSPSS